MRRVVEHDVVLVAMVEPLASLTRCIAKSFFLLAVKLLFSLPTSTKPPSTRAERPSLIRCSFRIPYNTYVETDPQPLSGSLACDAKHY